MANTFVGTGSYPVRTGNRVTPWIDGLPTFRRLCAAIDGAHASVFVTITFLWPTFEMPDGHGPVLDVLARAARRGVDVRLLCWRPDDETAALRDNAFWGSSRQLARLDGHYPELAVRWDRAHPGFCQHQKVWIIDADLDSAIAFTGSLNLNPHSLADPTHRGTHQNHDVCVELAGPAVADVHHNFVQRWNEASERMRDDGRRGARGGALLAYPTRVPPVRGDSTVQVQRTTHAGRYRDETPAPGAAPYPTALGERTNLAQYVAAIEAARRTVYLEHQAVDVVEIIDALDAALARGVPVLALVPASPDLRSPAIAALSRLDAHDGFMACGIAGVAGDGSRMPVHVHAKLMIVDDEWATVGSCNLHRYSLFGNGELNVAFHDAQAVRALRVALFREHINLDTAALDDREAMAQFSRIAQQNSARHARQETNWQGLAVALACTPRDSAARDRSGGTA